MTGSRSHPAWRTPAWRRYFDNHPNVLASWNEQNGREPSCTCPACKPEPSSPSAGTASDR